MNITRSHGIEYKVYFLLYMQADSESETKSKDEGLVL